MPRELWNEGRVVGYSAYEMYVRHHLSVMPDTPPASEKEWLASMMAMGSSMLLRVSAEDAGAVGSHYIEVEFPEKCRLCAANNIIASFFSGEGYVESNSTGWATKVTDYGPLICNESASNSPDNNGNIPPMFTNIDGLSADTINQIREYMKIVDGIVIQPGTWTTNLNKPPYKDFTPKLSQVPKLRILLNDRVEKDFFILLTGFTNRTVVDGQTGFDSAVNTKSPADGDFLGPWAFPWAAKIFFSVPSSFVNYFMRNKYTRELELGTESITVKSDAVIDFNQNYTDYQSDYYKDEDTDAALSVNVTEIASLGEDSAVLATYMHKHEWENGITKLPPSLYGALIDGTGEKKFFPIDTTAPGSLKLYGGDITSEESNSPVCKAKVFEDTTCNTTAFMREEGDSASYVVHEIDDKGNIIPVSNDTTININNMMTAATDWIYFFCHDTHGNIRQDLLKDVKSLAFEELIAGYISDDIINNFGLSYEEFSELKEGIPDNIQNIYGEYWNTIADKNNYVAIITGPKSLNGATDAQLGYMLANKNTGQVAYMGTNALGWDLNGLDFTYGADFTSDNPHYNTSVTDFLGTWWNESENCRIDDYGIEVIPLSNHKCIDKVAASYANSFYQNRQLVPYFKEDYPDFRYYFDSIKFSDFLSKFGKTEESIGLHRDFRGLSLQELLKQALMKNVTRADDDSNNKINILGRYIYFYDRKHLPKPGVPDINRYATMRAYIPAPSKSIFEMRPWIIYKRGSDAESWDDKTSEVNRPDSHIYAAKGQSGHNTTTGISLVDSNNLLLNTLGTSRKMYCDTIKWSDLLIALNTNQRIDLLNDAVVRKTESNVNYIITANGTHLYISKSEPKDDDIPDGSIGIGW